MVLHCPIIGSNEVQRSMACAYVVKMPATFPCLLFLNCNKTHIAVPWTPCVLMLGFYISDSERSLILLHFLWLLTDPSSCGVVGHHNIPDGLTPGDFSRVVLVYGRPPLLPYHGNCTGPLFPVSSPMTTSQFPISLLPLGAQYWPVKCISKVPSTHLAMISAASSGFNAPPASQYLSNPTPF